MFFPKISLRHHHATIAGNGAFSHEIDWYKSYGDFAEFLLFDKVVKLVVGGSVINGAYPT